MGHIHKKIDFTVEVFIVHDNKVLLRKHEKYHKWLSVGGHIELDEDPNQAAHREVKEETGLDITLYQRKPHTIQIQEVQELIPPEFMIRHKTSDTHEHVVLIYFARTEQTTIQPQQEEEQTETKWFSREELEENKYGITKDILTYAHAALDALGKNCGLQKTHDLVAKKQ